MSKSSLRGRRLFFVFSVLVAPRLLLPAQQEAGDSPSGAIHYELRKAADDSKEIWLFPKDRKEEAVKLCETPGWGNLVVHFSPDDYWIIVQDGGASLGVSLRLFRRQQGVRFQEIKEADIDGQAEKFALRERGLPQNPTLDHRYAAVLAWSADSKRILIRLSGSGGNEKRYIRLSEWTSVYELGSGKFSFDLKEMNRAALEYGRQ